MAEFDATGMLGWMNSTIACSISIHSWGNSKGVKAGEVLGYSQDLAEKAANKRISMSKRLIECQEYKAIVSRDGHAGKWFAEHSVPSLFRKGVYCVPVAFMQEWTDYLESYGDERLDMVMAFERAYSDAAWNARQELGELYRAEDYPIANDVRARFWIDVRYLELSVPDRLEHIDPQTFARAREELAASVEQGKLAIEHILAEEAAELIAGLRTALSGLDDGTLKRFHDSHVEKIREWSGLFLAGRNVTNSTELADVVQSLQDIVTAQSIPVLRSFEQVRATVKRDLAQCQSQLKEYMEARPSRRISLDD